MEVEEALREQRNRFREELRQAEVLGYIAPGTVARVLHYTDYVAEGELPLLRPHVAAEYKAYRQHIKAVRGSLVADEVMARREKWATSHE